MAIGKPSIQRVCCAYKALLALAVAHACPETFCLIACSMCTNQSRTDTHRCCRLSPKLLLPSESHLQTVQVLQCSYLPYEGEQLPNTVQYRCRCLQCNQVSQVQVMHCFDIQQTCMNRSHTFRGLDGRESQPKG